MNRKKYRGLQAGAIMLLIAWFIFMGMLTFFFSKYVGEQDNPNRELVSKVGSDGVREVILKVNRYNHYVLLGKVNGKDVEFMIDTGASDVSVPEKLQKLLSLKAGRPIKAQTASGSITVYLTRIKTIEIGPIKLNDISASINPHMDSKQILLGMSALKKLEFIQKEGILILRQKVY